VKECLSGAAWTAGQFACKPPPTRALEFGGLGDRAPVFTFYSVSGDVSVRLESRGADPRSVYLELQSGQKGTFLKSWIIGMMNNFALSICFGTSTSLDSNVCPMKIDSEGVVHITGAAYFHGKVKYAKVEEEVNPNIPNVTNVTSSTESTEPSSTESNATNSSTTVDRNEVEEVQEESLSEEDFTSMQSELGEPKHPQGVKVDAGTLGDGESMGDGELPESDVSNKKVWWGRESDALALIQTDADATVEPQYYTTVGGTGPQTPAAKWMTENGKIGIRLESQNALEAKNVYLELRNRNRRDSWGLGMRKDLNFYAGYGELGTYGQGTKKNAFKVAPNKEVTFLKNVVFHKQPSYFKQGSELDLTPLSAATNFDDTPSYGNVFRAKTEGEEVPEVPNEAEDALGSTSSAQPLVAYHSDDSVSVRLTAESTQSLKEAFVEFRSQKKRAWRLALHPDGDLFLTFHAAASLTAGEKVIKFTKDGAVHFYGDVAFGGKTSKTF